MMKSTRTSQVPTCLFAQATMRWMTIGRCPALDAGGVFVFPSSQSGSDLSFNIYQASDAVLTTASVDVSDYSAGHVSAVVEPNNIGGYLESTDGWTISVNKDGVNTGVVASLYDDVVANTSLSAAVDLSTVNALQVVVEGDAPDAGEDIYIDDIQVQGYGKKGCVDVNATNYDSSASADDGSCILTLAYSYYDGGFTDKIWRGEACTGGIFGCGSAPFVKAVNVDAARSDRRTSFNYRISSGTTVTVDGTQLNAESGLYELFVKDLYVEDGGLVNVPAGHVIVVIGHLHGDGFRSVYWGRPCLLCRSSIHTRWGGYSCHR